MPIVSKFKQNAEKGESDYPIMPEVRQIIPYDCHVEGIDDIPGDGTRAERPLEKPKRERRKLYIKFRKMKFNKVHPMKIPEWEYTDWENMVTKMYGDDESMDAEDEDKENSDMFGAKSLLFSSWEANKSAAPVFVERPAKVKKLSKKRVRRLEKIQNQAELEERAKNFIYHHCTPRKDIEKAEDQPDITMVEDFRAEMADSPVPEITMVEDFREMADSTVPDITTVDDLREMADSPVPEITSVEDLRVEMMDSPVREIFDEEPKVQIESPLEKITSSIIEEGAVGQDEPEQACASTSGEEPKKKKKGFLRRVKKIASKVFIMKTSYMY